MDNIQSIGTKSNTVEDINCTNETNNKECTVTSVDQNLGKRHRSENVDISVLEISDSEETVCKK